MSLATRLQVLLALACLATGHVTALVAVPALLGLLALRALARHNLGVVLPLGGAGGVSAAAAGGPRPPFRPQPAPTGPAR